MPADSIIGLQYGSEGKGNIAAALAPLYDGAVRVGAPNAGHTIIKNDKVYKMRQIPCAWVNPKCRLFIGPGGLINEEVLAHELYELPESVPHRLRIDRNAGVVTPDHIKEETDQKFNERIGSTSEGIGVAQALKVRRVLGIAVENANLAAYITDVAREINAMIDEGQNIQIEGTQGFGLCLNHGTYPFCTSRDILAASLLSDVGLAPSVNRFVFGVMRTYPIRVAGNSGPMGAPELTWDVVAKRAGYDSIEERTTVTKRIRRVSEIDWELLSKAVMLNRPTGIFVTFADYLDAKLKGINDWDVLMASDVVAAFVGEIENKLGVRILGLTTGPHTTDIAYSPEWREIEEVIKSTTNQKEEVS